jgi:AcrR family transcriptional regulator
MGAVTTRGAGEGTGKLEVVLLSGRSTAVEMGSGERHGHPSRLGARRPMSENDPTKNERLRKGRTLAERRWERREALLDAALDLFGTQGYATTSVEELCRTAYVSTRNFYEEFDNREAVLFALGDRLVGEAYQAMVESTFEDGPDRLQREARARVGALAHALLDDPRRARIAFIETLGVSPVQEARRRNAHRLFAQYFAALVRADFSSEGFGTRDEDIFAVALVGAINEILSDWVLRTDKPPLDDLIDRSSTSSA